MKMDEELIKMLKYIRLPGLVANWDHYLGAAGKGNYSHARLLKHIIKKSITSEKRTQKKCGFAAPKYRKSM